MTADGHRELFAGGGATGRQQREPDVAVDLIVEHVPVRLGQRQLVLPIMSADWHRRSRRRHRRTGHRVRHFSSRQPVQRECSFILVRTQRLTELTTAYATPARASTTQGLPTTPSAPRSCPVLVRRDGVSSR